MKPAIQDPTPTHPLFQSVEYWGGNFPVTMYGLLSNNLHYNFRARGHVWTFGIGSTEDADDWVWTEEWGTTQSSGEMPYDEVIRLIDSCAAMYEQGVPVPQSFVGWDDNRVDAHNLAMLILADIGLYHAEALRSGPPETALERVVAEVAEARQLFRARTDPSLHVLFDNLVHLLESSAAGVAMRTMEIVDEQSAKSLGQRHAAYLAAVPDHKRLEATRQFLAIVEVAVDPGLLPILTNQIPQ